MDSGNPVKVEKTSRKNVRNSAIKEDSGSYTYAAEAEGAAATSMVVTMATARKRDKMRCFIVASLNL